MEKYKIFMVMPFDTELNDLYRHIKSLIEDDFFQVFRADDLLNQQNILKDIVVSIHESDLIIADLTGLNPNVFYELGLAHAFRKNVVLLTQDVSELPFDLRSYRVIQYSTHFSKIKDLEESLRKVLHDIKSSSISFGNPVTDWIRLDSINENPTNKITVIQKEDKLNNAPVVAVDIIEEKGFLDYIADIEESMEKLTNIVSDFEVKTTEMSNDITIKGNEIRSAWEKPSTGTASYVRKLARKAAETMNNYGAFISQSNKQYESVWDIFEDSISNLVISPLLKSSPENIDGFADFLTLLENLKNSIIPAIDGISSMAEGAISLKGMEGSITRSVSLIELEAKTFIGLLDKSVSTLDRVISVGKSQIIN